jgi:hypothetical protein
MLEILKNSPAQKIRDFQVLRNALISDIKVQLDFLDTNWFYYGGDTYLVLLVTKYVINTTN